MPTFKKTEADKIILGLYDQFHKPEFLEWDPLSVVRRYPEREQEWIALLAALFAFGGVKQIIAALNKVLGRLEDSIKYDRDELHRRLEGFRHRIYVGEDVGALILLYRKSVDQYGSLKGHFLAHHPAVANTVEAALAGVIADYKSWAHEDKMLTGRHFKHLLNSPADGGACKRWLMYLKWMIRKNDGIDLGLWGKSALESKHLVIPLDVHLFRISRRLGLTKLKSANWKSALQVTTALKRLDSGDPTKYDFSLCRFGMFNVRGMTGDLKSGLRPNSR